MVDVKEYYVYDYRRDRSVMEFEAEGDEVAIREFADWYNRVVRPDRWEGRRLGRYWLFEFIRNSAGELIEPRPLSVDENIRLSRMWMFVCDPPHDAEAWAAQDAEYARLDGLDVARLASRPANVFAEHLDDGKRVVRERTG